MPASAVAATVDALREEILRRSGGELLGSEDDLLRQLAVSRPTLRQAARVLEAEEVLEVRRGLGGGFFTRRPSTDAVTRMASSYLRAQGAPVIDVARTWFVLLAQSAKLAAAGGDPESRASIAARVTELSNASWADDEQAAFAAIQALAVELADGARSATVGLFTRVLSTLVADAPADLRPVRGIDALRPQLRATLDGVADAIRDGDAPGASACMRAHGEVLIAWLEAHMPDRAI